MKICYVAAVTVDSVTADQGIIERAVSNAIQSAVVEPLKVWLLNGWIRFINISYAFCLAVSITGILCGMLGIKKCYRAAVASIVFYLILRMFSWALGWY